MANTIGSTSIRWANRYRPHGLCYLGSWVCMGVGNPWGSWWSVGWSYGENACVWLSLQLICISISVCGHRKWFLIIATYFQILASLKLPCSLYYHAHKSKSHHMTVCSKISIVSRYNEKIRNISWNFITVLINCIIGNGVVFSTSTLVSLNTKLVSPYLNQWWPTRILP